MEDCRVYIISTECGRKRRKNLERAFKHTMFEVITFTPDTSFVDQLSVVSHCLKDSENCRRSNLESDIWSLSTSSISSRFVRIKSGRVKEEKQRNIIIIFDTVILACSDTTLVEEICRFGRMSNRYDACYLHRYMDTCQKCRLVSDGDENDYELYSCYSPKGLDAVIYTPSGRRKFLDHDLQQNNVESLCFSPGLFQYDIHNNAHETRDYDKTVTCAPLQRRPEPLQGASTQTLVMLVVIIIVVIFLAYALLYLGPTG